MPRGKRRPGVRGRPRRAADGRRIVLDPEPLKVVGSRRLRRAASHHFRILRPADLVVLDVLGYDLELRVGSKGPALGAPSGSGRLEVRYTFQHLFEAAEVDNEAPPHNHGVPIPSRAAYGSRLVFAVSGEERIDYSVEGVLAAISRLPLLVAPLATPKQLLRRLVPSRLKELVAAGELPGGLRLYRADGGLVVAPAPSDAGPKLSGARRLIRTASGLRAARVLLANERAINLSDVQLGAGKRGFGRLAPGPGRFRPRRARPRRPRSTETAIEAPFRLILSPSELGGFAHATSPQVVGPHPDRAGDPQRAELWHSRLGVRRVDSEGGVEVDEARDPQKVVRAIWTRDQDSPAPDAAPFPVMSVNSHDRKALVRQSADPRLARPEPVDVDRLYLTSLGAWLELHGRWVTQPYTAAGHQDSIKAWDHEATSGRDNYVRLVYPFYLFPFGHRCSLVKITERKIKQIANPEARLYQRKFITVQQPVRTFDDRSMPFRQVRIRPLVTPDLDLEHPSITDADGERVLKGSVIDPVSGIERESLFWPTVDDNPYRFVLDCLDHDGRRAVLQAPLLAVHEALGIAAQKEVIKDTYTDGDNSHIPGRGQMVAVAASTVPGDTAYETVELRFTGDPGAPGSQTSTPHLDEADIVVPAMRHLAPTSSPVTVKYASAYLGKGFGGSNEAAQVLLELKNMASISFGGGTDEAGGFIQPDLPVRGLSRAIGVVGDVTSVSPPDPSKAFDPSKFLDGVLPRLFGLFELTDILAIAGLDKAPKFVTDQLDMIAALVADLEELTGAIDSAVLRLASDAAEAPTSALQAQAEEARTAIAAVQSSFANLVQQFNAAVESLMALDSASDLPEVTQAVSGILNSIAGLVSSLQETVRTLPLPPTAKAELERLTNALSPLLAASEIAKTIQAIADFVNGFDPSNMAVRARFDWRPELTNFPASATTEDAALFFVPKDGFVLSVEARASASDGVGADVLAELRDFGLNLFPDAPLVKIRFDRLAFRASTGRKAEVDVVFNGLEWQGILGFIARLQELIPFDGFSDPPYVDVSIDGLTAGFDLALPNISIGVFSLENISLGADVRVPFLGDALTFGFNFCTREKPFRLTYMAIGGGGFVGLRLSPKGMVLLEMAFEVGASLSIDLGVASGSVSVAVGIYMRLESDAGSLTGYFRIRGEVDVLGLISASITLELTLTYEFATGKMIGRASIEIEVEVLFFSATVTVSCERRLAGSNGDPTLAQILGLPEDGQPIAAVPPAWTNYCSAFAGA